MSFMRPEDYPAIAPLIDRLSSKVQDLAIEGVKGIEFFSPSPEVYIMDDIRLFILPAKWQGAIVDSAEYSTKDDRAWKPRATPLEMAFATASLRHIVDDPIVVNAMYSLSVPGCEIVPHIDRESAIGEVYRLHLGLRCPDGDCALTVDGETRRWEDGQFMLFDSARVTHSAHNRTAEPRLILIVDIDRRAMDAGIFERATFIA